MKKTGIVLVHPDGRIETGFFTRASGIWARGKKYTPEEYCEKFREPGTKVLKATLAVEIPVDRETKEKE